MSWDQNQPPAGQNFPGGAPHGHYPNAPGWPQQPAGAPGGQPAGGWPPPPGPPQGHDPHNQYGSSSQYGPPAGFPQPPFPPQKRSKLPLILTIIGVVVALGIGGTVVLLATGSDDSGDKGSSSNTISEDDLKADNGKKAFRSVLVNMMRQQIIRTRTEQFRSTSPTQFPQESEAGGAEEFAFDYETKQVAYERDLLGRERCSDGKKYDFSRYENKWEEERTPCMGLQSIQYKIGDSLIPGGLTEEQAENFIGYLEQAGNFIQVKEAKFVDKDRKRYARFVVDYTPVSSEMYGYTGLQYFTWAFKQTELDYKTHPYGTTGTGGEGRHLILYADPKTGLPVYEEMATTPAWNDQTKQPDPNATSSYSLYRYEFYFDKKLPTYDMTQNEPVKMTWQRELYV